jgi:hypothetical protein
MKKLSVAVLFVVISSFLIPNSFADDDKEKSEPAVRVKVSVGPVWLSGIGEEIGSVVRYSMSGNGTAGLDYRFDTKPLSLSGRRTWATGIDFTFPKIFDNLDVVVRYRSVISSESLDGVVSSSLFDKLELGILQYWDANLFPFPNSHYPGGLSPIAYRASQKLVVHDASITLSPKTAGLSRAYYGLNFLYSRYRVELGMENWAFIYRQSYGFDYTFDNHVTITSKDEASVFAAGPYVSFERDFPISESFSVSATASAALLVGGYRTGNWFHDIDDAYELVQNSDTAIYSPIYYDGWVNYGDSRVTMIPFAEVEANILYGPWENVTIGMGFWGKSLFNYPVQTRLHAPWDIGNWVAAPSGLNFKLERQNIYAYGVLLKFQYAF